MSNVFSIETTTDTKATIVLETRILYSSIAGWQAANKRSSINDHNRHIERKDIPV